MTILNTHCPQCGTLVDPMAVDRKLIEATLGAVFKTLRASPPERLRVDMTGTYAAALMMTCGYCGGCADTRSEERDTH